jgi:hypothetical protein
MTRLLSVGAAVLLVFALSGPPSITHAAPPRLGSALREPLPLPPTPPADGPPGRSAPIPDPSAQSPHGTDDGAGPVVAPAWFAARSYSPSQGFLPGSHVDARPDGRTEIAPGVNVRVPLR